MSRAAAWVLKCGAREASTWRHRLAPLTLELRAARANPASVSTFDVLWARQVALDS